LTDNTPAPEKNEVYTVKVDGDALLDAFARLTDSVTVLLDSMANFEARLQALEERKPAKGGRGFKA
jgi:hypothetical protein